MSLEPVELSRSDPDPVDPEQGTATRHGRLPRCRRTTHGPRTCVLGSLAAIALGLGCANAPVAPPAAATPGADALHFRLVFGATADLDLYVTGPDHETVYFANTPSAAGGALDADVRCDGPTTRVEAVVFPAPRAGRYRVGVDYPQRCGLSRAPVPFLVVVEGPGLVREARGKIALGQFRLKVLELDIE